MRKNINFQLGIRQATKNRNGDYSNVSASVFKNIGSQPFTVRTDTIAPELKPIVPTKAKVETVVETSTEPIIESVIEEQTIVEENFLEKNRTYLVIGGLVIAGFLMYKFLKK